MDLVFLGTRLGGSEGVRVAGEGGSVRVREGYRGQ